MKLYVANLNRQVQDFVFRIPEAGKLQSVIIPIGGQAVVWDGTTEVLNGILDQHAAYGVVSVREAKRLKVACALCYQFDKPVPIDTVLDCIQQNAAKVTETAAEQRKISAIVAGAYNRGHAHNNGLPRVTGFEVEIVEQTTKDDHPRNAKSNDRPKKPKLHERYHVDLNE